MRRSLVAIVFSAYLAACGGGGGGAQKAVTYTIGGTVSGLAGSGLVLHDSTAGSLTISSGSFTFPTQLASGSAFAVTVSTQPTNPSQTCVVTNGTGTASSNITNISVACSTNSFLIGGTASGLGGSPLTLVLNGGTETIIRTNGAFAFPTAVASGSAYTVAAKFQRVNAQQNCFVTASTATGIVGNSDVAGVRVVCATVGRFAYVVTSGGTPSVAAYAIDGSTGFLTSVPGPSVTTGSLPLSINVDPAGTFLYVVNSMSNDVSAYAIDRATGALTSLQSSPYPMGVSYIGAFESEIDASGRFLYVGGERTGSIGSIFAFTIDATTGALTPVPGSPFDPGGPLGALTIDPAGQFLYAIYWSYAAGDYVIEVFSIDGMTGALKPFGNTSPFLATSSPQCLSIEPSGRFAYAKSSQSKVGIYAIDPTNHNISLTSGSPFPTALDTGCFTIDPTGRFAYLNNSTSTHGNYFSGYAIDAATGVLTPIVGSPFGISALSDPIAFDPSGAFAFQVSRVANTIAVYDMSSGNGIPAQVGYSPFPVNAPPGAIVISP